MSAAEDLGYQERTHEYKWVGKNVARTDGVDKVTGRAQFGADLIMPGMLFGAVMRSPHAHAKINGIDTSKAEALKGVKAVICRDDFADQPSEMIQVGELSVNIRDVIRNVMAREKAMYDGHAIAAVAATSSSIARKALKLIEVDYEVLPHVIDVEEAMKPDAPILNEELYTDGVEPKPTKPSNIAKRLEIKLGDVEQGFSEAEVIIEREYRTRPVHQGYIEPHACVASYTEDGQGEVWASTPGHFLVRAITARPCGMDVSKVKATASEIGGGFGGKNIVYLEPLAMALSRKCGRPVKMAMHRNEVFRATGPTSGAHMKVKIGAKRDGKITAGWADLRFQAGAFPGSPVFPAAMCAYACYDLENVLVIGWDVVANRPKTTAYRAPGAQISAFAVESAMDELARELDIDPIDLRLMNAAKEGTKAAYGPTFGPVGQVETLKAIKNHPNYNVPLGPNQGRGVASGFWFNIGGETSVTMNVNDDGTIALTLGNPDLSGTRTSISVMAAEELGIEPERIRPTIGDTTSLGFNFISAGSRTTFAVGKATVETSRVVIDELRARAAKTWDIPVEAVVWEDGHARPASSNAGSFEPLSLEDIAREAKKTGGPIAGHVETNVTGAGPSFATEAIDVEVDPETGYIKVLRFTAAQDAGRAIQPNFVEGQFQGAAVQGIGWALNEEYIYDDKGRMENPGFLDYRMPVASDLPMIDAVIVEVPNPNHPYGVRGIGETSIVPVMAATANALEDASGVRINELPMSPPRVLKALNEKNGH